MLFGDNVPLESLSPLFLEPFSSADNANLYDGRFWAAREQLVVIRSCLFRGVKTFTLVEKDHCAGANL